MTDDASMKILAIDTSSKFLSIALGEKDTILVEETHLLERRHSSLLVVKIRELLEKSGVSIDDVSIFAAGLGPGSFTGLRIGVSAVKGFSIATGKTSLGAPSIDALALNANEEERLIVPIIDAKRQQLYSAVYQKKKNRLIRKTKYLLLKPEDLLKKINEPAVFLGDGIALYRDRIKRLNKKAVFLDERFWYPKASCLIRLVLSKIDRHNKGDLSKLRPMYLYAKDCQVNCARPSLARFTNKG